MKRQNTVWDMLDLGELWGIQEKGLTGNWIQESKSKKNCMAQ